MRVRDGEPPPKPRLKSWPTVFIYFGRCLWGRALQPMEGSLLLTANSSLPNFGSHFYFSFTLRHHSLSSTAIAGNFHLVPAPFNNTLSLSSPPRASVRTCSLALDQPPANHPRDMSPKIDKSGKFCSPRAARELAL